ncbi:MAG: leucyl-tRNA synthetase [Thermoplasmata archaeon]|jgi:leucyl-tRNA synthetase|nr:leucyl-tRNA synthetase [Thermoplasmata archaeon]
MVEDERGWDLAAITDKWQSRWWDAKVHHADRNPSGKPTFFLHFAYPGISGYLHVGHMRGFTYTDVFARHKRMTGHDVLFPAGFHASGIPSVAFAAEVKRGEKDDYLRANGYTGPIQALADPKAVVDYFAKVYTNDYWKRFGFLIDERRNVTTIDPAYMRFIQWQFRALHQKGRLIEKPHYAPFCPVAGPVAVDKSETDIKQGGSAEILEYVALKFTLPRNVVHEERVVLPCATLRPETVYGCTNVWMHPETEYHLVRVWQDGAVADKDPSELWLVSAAGKRKLEWQFERAEATGRKVPARQLIGHKVRVPMEPEPGGREVPIVAGAFVDPAVATGIVMSVPAHAPFDYAAYRDAGLVATLGEPPVICTVEGAPKGIPARLAVERHKVQSQHDKDLLQAATEELYAEEFNKGVLTEACGPYAGKRIKGVKDQIKQDFLAAGRARVLRQFSELVVSRAGEVVDVKRIPDQDFIHYGDPEWTRVAKGHAATMAVFPQRYKDELPNVLDWFGDRACVRRGAWLGTEFPFKPGWIVEPIADSTFYPWFYLVSRYLKSRWNPDPPHGGLREEELTDAFFDHVFNGKGEPARALWSEVRKDVLHWGPVDLNLGGKEHQTVHFPVYIMTQVALLDDPKLWPRGIFVNWWVTQKAGAKISKSKGGAEPIPGAAARYGVDAMRLYYCHVGSPHVDIEWDPDIVLDYRRHVERLLRATEEALAADGGPHPTDAWLAAAFARTLANARDAYEAYDLRGAAGALVYEVPEVLRWYARRGGANRQALRDVLLQWALALCPIVPHVAEEMHEMAGGKGLATTAAFPVPGPVDAAALASEAYVRLVLEDIQTVQRLAGVERVHSLALYTTPAWKRELAAKAVQMAAAEGGKFPMGRFMGEVMADPKMRALGKPVQAFTGKLPAQVTQLTADQKTLLAARADEAVILAGAKGFLASHFGLAAVEVYAADDPAAPQHPKKDVAAPLKPGIALA